MEKKKNKITVLQMTQMGLLTALTLIMGLTPLGTIRTPFMSVSLVTIPVAVAAIMLGIPGGAVCGTVFGATSFFNAATGTSGMMTMLFNVSAFGVFFTTMVPRILEGVLTAVIFKALHSFKKLEKTSYYIASVSCPLLNTLMFMSCVVIFFYNSDYVQQLASDLGAKNPFSFVVMLVGIQGIIEALTCLIIGGAVSNALWAAKKK